MSFKESGYQRGRRSFIPGSFPTIWLLGRFLHFDPFRRFAARIVYKLYFDRVADVAISQSSLGIGQACFALIQVDRVLGTIATE